MRTALALGIVAAIALTSSPAQADRIDDLTAGVLRLSDPPTATVARANVIAAVNAETTEVPAELLLSVAWRESRYDNRTLGSFDTWHHDYPPKGAHNFYCGVTQAEAHGSWSTCLTLRDPETAYRTTVEELGRWTERCRHKVKSSAVGVCALAGYGGGNAGLTTPKIWRSARAAYARASWLRAQRASELLEVAAGTGSLPRGRARSIARGARPSA